MLKPEVAEKMTELIGPMTGRRILEIGTGWGESATFFSKLKPEWKIYTIDAFGLYGDGRIYSSFKHEDVFRINDMVRKCGNVIQILGDSSSIPWELPIDALFLDADHTWRGCSDDFFRFAPWVRPGGFVIFDDYNQPNNPANGVKQVVAMMLGSSDLWEMIYEGYYCAILKRK